ncbi:MAG TPA: site-2 protease family protein [Candidatus Uhrbacteria bacterium]|nr:site-2 protease family protein [Candidatus Uhrbacteria bacterium]
MEFGLIYFISIFAAFFLALSVHEFAHALSAYQLGDSTAQQAGRLTLNPIAHIDLIGTILLPLFLILSNAGIVFGWAKPVPVNYFNLKNQKWGPAIVSFAGPLANFIFGVFCIIILRLVNQYALLGPNNLLVSFLFFLIIINFVLMIFNLIPIPPLDGSKILFALLPESFQNIKIFLEQYGLILLFVLLIFGSGFLSLIFFYLYRIIEMLV